jgi:predicted ATP-binding protein involved in virulence
LLKNYINNVSNTSKFKEYYTQQLKEVITQLVKQHKEVKDKVTKIKLKETINVLKNNKIGRVVSDNQVSAMMIAFELISEIKNVRKEA